MSKEYIAFKCLECGVISVFPSIIADGNRCIECKGPITPIGEARVYKKRSQSITIGVNVDTTQLDKALEKARELKDCLIGIDLAEGKDMTTYIDKDGHQACMDNL